MKKLASWLKILAGILAAIWSSQHFGGTHTLEWVPQLFEAIGGLGLVIGGGLGLSGISDLVSKPVPGLPGPVGMTGEKGKKGDSATDVPKPSGSTGFSEGTVVKVEGDVAADFKELHKILDRIQQR